MKGLIDMTRRVLTTIGSATAVATAVGACLLLGPTPQAAAVPLCDQKTGNCVAFTKGGFQVTNGSKSVATVTWSPFCVMGTSSSTPFNFGAC